MRSRADAPAFVAAVMHGKPVANLCSKLVQPGPIQTADE